MTTDINKLRAVAEAAIEHGKKIPPHTGKWYDAEGAIHIFPGTNCDPYINYIVAAMPEVIIELLARLERAEADARRYRKWRELKTMSLIPGPLFMAMFENETDAALDSLILEDQPC